MQNNKPKKSLGQHFLRDQNIARKIIDSITDHSRKILEIGPGEGILTDILIEKGYDVEAIEIDEKKYRFLVTKYPRKSNIFIHDDFLKYDFTKLDSRPVNIIGNLPYNISSQILFKILDHYSHVNEVICMIQKEVAERICASHGNKTYGILSVLLQTYFKVEYLFTVNPKVFYPPPKVKSAVIRLKNLGADPKNFNEPLFRKIIKLAFNQRRKILSNSLKPILLNLEIDSQILKKRPEELDVGSFIKLTDLIDKKIIAKNISLI